MTFDQAMSYLKIHNTIGDKVYVESAKNGTYVTKSSIYSDYYAWFNKTQLNDHQWYHKNTLLGDNSHYEFEKWAIVS